MGKCRKPNKNRVGSKKSIMYNKITHIKTLVHFAYVDKHLHEKEKKFIIKVGERLGLNIKTVEQLIQKKVPSMPPLPKDEVLRFVLLDDIFNLIVSDKIITEEEIKECKQVAEEFGFEENIVDPFITKLKSHIKDNFSDNQTTLFIKNEMFKLTLKNYTNAKYN
jgi:uncharacterized tellurite resistance protein B-like protein